MAEAGHGSRLPRGRREREMAGHHHWDRAFDAALIPAHPEALSEQFGPNKYIEATAMVAEQAQQTSAKEEWERDVRARLWAERTVAFNEISVQSEQIVEARAFMDEAAVELRTESEQLAYERAHSERWERYAETLRAQLTEAVKKEHECQQIAREEQWESYVDIVKEELEHEKKVTNEAREHDAIWRERDKLWRSYAATLNTTEAEDVRLMRTEIQYERLEVQEATAKLNAADVVAKALRNEIRDAEECLASQSQQQQRDSDWRRLREYEPHDNKEFEVRQQERNDEERSIQMAILEGELQESELGDDEEARSYLTKCKRQQEEQEQQEQQQREEPRQQQPIMMIRATQDEKKMVATSAAPLAPAPA